MGGAVSVQTLAKIIGIGQRRIQQLAKDGIIPKAESGKYDLIPCINHYCKFLRERAEGRSKEAKSGRENRERLTKAQADKTELEADMMRGNLLCADIVEKGISDLAANCRIRMLAIAPKLSPQLAALNNPEDIRKMIEAAVKEGLEEISVYVPDISTE